MTTKYHIYIFTTYLNASHAIRWSKGIGQAHPHTYEIRYSFHINNDKLIRFNEIENKIAEIIKKFNNQFLNEVEPFTKVNPTLENLTDYLFNRFGEELNKLNCSLDEISISESPMRTYQISIR